LARDYSSVTEVTGEAVTREAVTMMWTRYATAAEYCAGKDVLEVGCGSAQGLGHIAAHAHYVVGGDYTCDLVEAASRHYGSRVRFACLDGQRLPFRDRSFDVVILYEAIYYLADPEAFVAECCRVLRAGGSVLICSANREWAGFNPSPFSYRYYSARELGALLERAGFRVQLFGAFPDSAESLVRQLVGLIRRIAVALHLIPKTMSGKALLKRLFYGKLVVLGHELTEGMANVAPLVPLDGATATRDFKVVYAIGVLPAM